jgi:MATE family multidrug resistance protein
MDSRADMSLVVEAHDQIAPAGGRETARVELRRLLTLAAPTVGAKLSHMALGFTDFVVVSWMGTDATAAISPGTLAVFILLCLGMGSVTSVQTFAAQALGRGEPARAAAYVWQAFYVGAGFLVLTVPLVMLQRVFWGWVEHPPAVQEMEIAYCEVAFWSMGLAVMCVGLEGFFNGIQRPGVELASILVAIVFNAIADYALVFGKLGCPRMGIAGAAVATVMAWGIRVGMMLAVFLSHRVNERFQTRRAWRLDRERLMDIVRMGGPIGVQWFLDVGSWFVFLTLMMARFSTAALAAANIALQLMHLSFMPAVGLGVAVNSLVGHAIGAGRPEEARRHARAGLMVMMSYMTGAGVVYWLGRYWLMRLMSDDPAVIAAGAGILVWAAVFQAFDAMAINYIFALRGAGDTRWPSVLVVFHSWVTFILGGQVVMWLAPGMGIHGPWMMCTLYIILVGLGMWRRWRRGAWAQIRLFRDAAPAAGAPIAEPVISALDADAVSAPSIEEPR